MLLIHRLLRTVSLFVLTATTIGLNQKQFVFGFTSRVTQKYYQYSNNHKYHSYRNNIISCYATTNGDTDMNSGDIDLFMASLKSRVEEVTDRATKLPIIILDSILPRQVLNITVPADALLIQLIKTQITNETPYFGMLGFVRNRNRIGNGQLSQQQQLLLPLSTGVQVDIVGKPKMIPEDDGTTSIQIVLKGNMNRFKIDQEVTTTKDGWMEARVVYMNCVDDETEYLKSTTTDRYQLARAMSKARVLPKLVNEWIELARHRERQPNQIDTILNDIGTMPACEEPTNLSFWIGALINPLPALGVAYEIRPSLLLAKTAEERVDIVIEGIQNQYGTCKVNHYYKLSKLF